MFKTSRRLDPRTADLVYDEDEVEFLKAIDHWRQEHDYRIPNCAEVLAIARELGYVKHAPAVRV